MDCSRRDEGITQAAPAHLGAEELRGFQTAEPNPGHQISNNVRKREKGNRSLDFDSLPKSSHFGWKHIQPQTQVLQSSLLGQKRAVENISSVVDCIPKIYHYWCHPSTAGAHGHQVPFSQEALLTSDPRRPLSTFLSPRSGLWEQH